MSEESTPINGQDTIQAPPAQTAEQLAEQQRLGHVHGVFVTCENVCNIGGLTGTEIIQVSTHLLVKASMSGHATENEAIDYLDNYVRGVLEKLKFDLAARHILPGGMTQ